MTRSTPRRRRRFVPDVSSIEQRLLLSVAVTCIGQDGHDLVGPDASQGPDGIKIFTCKSPVSRRPSPRSP